MSALPASDATASAEPAAVAARNAARSPAGAWTAPPIPASPAVAREAAPANATASSAYAAIDSMILAPIVPAGTIVLFHGPHGIGLTHVMAGCAVAVAAGHSFLGWCPMRPATVLLVSGTMSEAALRARIHDATDARRDPRRRDESLRVVALGPDRAAVPDLATASGREAMAVLAEACDVIMIDDLAGLLPGNRLDDEAALWCWLAEQRRIGKTVIVSMASGHGARRRAEVAARNVVERLADVVIRLARVGRAKPYEGVNFELHIDRAWHVSARDRAGLEVWLEKDAGGSRWYVQPIALSRRERFDAMRSTGMSVSAAAREGGIPLTTAYRWYAEAAIEAEQEQRKRAAAAHERRKSQAGTAGDP